MSEWQPIDTAPKDGTELLLWLGELVVGTFVTGSDDYDMATGWWSNGERVHPSHWMPLPAPPH